MQLATGDFGEEDVELVKSVSDLNFPKCVILGNHDCWWTAGSFKRYMFGIPLCMPSGEFGNLSLCLRTTFSWQDRQAKRREDPYQDPDSITAQLLAYVASRLLCMARMHCWGLR